MKKLSLFFYLIFTSFLYAYAQPANDNFANAIDVSGLINSCSSDAAYTTVNGTSDLNAGSCWDNSGPKLNVWFKFTAPASGDINITVDINGTKGTQRRTQIALWQNDGITEVACSRYSALGTDDVVLGTMGLTPGNTYYISVDAYSTSYDGTFTLCLDDAVDYDFYEGAIDVTGIINSCSTDEAYTTVGATPDRNAGSCWDNSGPQLNRWFKFTAPASGVINITVDVEGTKGTQRRSQVALWQSDGITEVACSRYTYSGSQDVVLGALGLTSGNTYYISVDAYNTSYDGTFTLCLDDAVDYDFYEGAIDVTGIINGCSADEAYTTVGASPDRNAGSCWDNSGPQLNRWFKFTAPASGVINITVDITGTKGTQRRTQVALWQNDGITEVACSRYSALGTDDVVLGTMGLTPGNTYYISVDAYNTSYDGTFTLCLDDAVDYDFYEGAIDVTGIINGCSADEAYTTVGASPDRNAGSCWDNSGPQLNRWFKFTAPASGVINITVDINGTKGTQRRTQVALWQNDGITEVACSRYSALGSDDVVLGALGLTPGNTYYISVDAYNTSYDGTFTLCLDDAVDYDFYEGAIDVTGIINGCSADEAYTTVGASPDRNAGSCWDNSGPQLNRWFKFTAPASGVINITVDINGTKGTQRRTQVALWQSDGITEVACSRYSALGSDDVVLGTLGLTSGNTYYISIDAYNTSYDGTFTLCLDDAVDYDFYEGAIDVTGIINGCSANETYTTVGASPDRNAGSCWDNSGPQLNRWFKFTAPASGVINITVDVEGTKGTQRRTQVALWQSDGITEVACSRYTYSGSHDVVLGALGLTPGNTYYISVDAYNTSYDGTFTLCLDDAVDYDFYEGAELIADINNWCSADEAYTTIGASPDRNAGSCWNNSGPQLNRWFYFVAITDGISITVDIAGSKGTQRRTQVALWENDGLTEVACSRYTSSNSDDVVLETLGLTPGNTYYISVDTYNTSYDGTFTLCVDDNPSYDFYEGAIELTDLNNWCSSDAQFTTIGASPDLNTGSCWNNSGPQLNRWFKFTAISNVVTITIDVDGTKGTQRRTQLALWQSDGITEVDCQRYASNNDDVSISNSSLTIGNVYYISVDTYNTSYDGTFTLCIDNIDEIYYSRGNGPWSNNNSWSTVSHSGPAAADYPKVGDLAYIESNRITINSNETCAELNMNAATNTTNLTINSGSLIIQGQLNMTNPGNTVSSTITVRNSTLTVNDNLTINRNGGTGTIDISLDNSTVTVNKDLEIFSTAGTNDNTINIINASSLSISENALFSNTGGPKTTMNIDASSVTFFEDLTLTASADNKNEIALVNTGVLNLKKDVIRGTPAYGILNCATGTTVNFNSTDYLQVFPHSTGSGTGDTFTYQNVTINNTRITTPQLTLDGEVTINESLTLTNGEVLTTSSNLLTLASGASVSGASLTSFVDGPMKKIGNTDFEFPVGDNNFWQPLNIANLSGDAATEFTAEYNYSEPTNISSIKDQGVGATLNNVSGLEYWDLSNTGTASNADITLHWKDQTRSVIDDYDDLVIAHYDGAEWENLGQSSRVASDPGSITVSNVSTFSPFTFGSLSNLVNPLPVELVSFEGKYNGNTVELEWITASELNNDYFEIERSSDGLAFASIGQVAGMGTSTIKNIYNFHDESPIFGIIYYRLKQVDFDGVFEYSKVISIDVPLAKNIELNIYPNPYKNNTNISYILPEKARVQIVVNSITGAQLDVLVNEVQDPGAYSIPFNSNKSGMLILHFNIGGQVMTQKIVKY